MFENVLGFGGLPGEIQTAFSSASQGGRANQFQIQPALEILAGLVIERQIATLAELHLYVRRIAHGLGDPVLVNATYLQEYVARVHQLLVERLYPAKVIAILEAFGLTYEGPDYWKKTDA